VPVTYNSTSRLFADRSAGGGGYCGRPSTGVSATTAAAGMTAASGHHHAGAASTWTHQRHADPWTRADTASAVPARMHTHTAAASSVRGQPS